MKILENKLLIILITTFIGSIAGFIYWNQIGCISGTCPITSHWYTSTIYGATLGGLFGSMISKEKRKE
jgi:hypothetical protein